MIWDCIVWEMLLLEDMVRRFILSEHRACLPTVAPLSRLAAIKAHMVPRAFHQVVIRQPAASVLHQSAIYMQCNIALHDAGHPYALSAGRLGVAIG